MLNLDALNESQLKAVTHDLDNNLLIVAGPGSGKTFTITQRIFYLINNLNIPPESILVVTFTKEAALSMQERFIKNSEEFYPVNFGTFHSIFYNILKQSNQISDYKIITENQNKEIINKATKDYVKNFDNNFWKIMSDAISLYKNTEDEAVSISDLDENIKPMFRSIFNRYEKYRKDNKVMDFDDMLWECRSMLSDSASIRERWQNRFRVILMDEFQDINPVQMKTVELLKGKECRLFAVGDDDQSIYGFRGSYPKCMQRYIEVFDAETIILDVNYRSTKKIVDSSLKVISQNKSRFVKKISAASKEDGHVVIKPFTDKNDECRYLVRELKKISEGNQTMAVLFRTNLQMQNIATELTKAGIVFNMKEKVSSIYENTIVKDIWAYLELAENMNNRKLLAQIINRPVRYINREALMVSECNMYDSMCRYYAGMSDVLYRDERIAAINKLKKDLDFIKGKTMYLAVKYICKSMGYEEFIMRQPVRSSNDIMHNTDIFEWIYGESKKYNNLDEWKIAKKEYDSNICQKKCNKNVITNINLMTVHASKGLEFDNVIIPDCNENIFPHGRMPDSETVEEERRIFYVAMTRAKKNLELLYLTGTRESPRLPSRFINPLLQIILHPSQ